MTGSMAGVAGFNHQDLKQEVKKSKGRRLPWVRMK